MCLFELKNQQRSKRHQLTFSRAITPIKLLIIYFRLQEFPAGAPVKPSHWQTGQTPAEPSTYRARVTVHSPNLNVTKNSPIQHLLGDDSRYARPVPENPQLLSPAA